MVSALEYSLSDLRKALERISEELLRHKDILTLIDSLSGDGDLGMSMEKVAHSLTQELRAEAQDGVAGLMLRCAQRVNTNAPSTMGTLLSLSGIEAAKLLQGKESLSDRDLLRIPAKSVETIMIHGRAQRGDKTVLDALIPYSEALMDCWLDTQDIGQAAIAAAQVAETAAKETKGCIAKIGRAKWIAERSRDCPDGGAVVCAIIVNAIIGKQLTVSL